MNAAPCLHYLEAPSRCLVGRNAPRDCFAGCAAYAADLVGAMSLDPAEQVRREIWGRVIGKASVVSGRSVGEGDG